MSRNKRKNRRDVKTPIANNQLPVSFKNQSFLPTLDLASSLSEISDRRLYNPNRPYTASTFSGSDYTYRTFAKNRALPKFISTRNVPNSGTRPRQRRMEYTHFTTAFNAPDRVLICQRRRIRKEVLFAFKKTGRGGAKQRKPRFNVYSHISCRR